ncbi:copper chaperone PCu(A)C [Candidatus Saccharibacteria bacterium]|nr:copper chaperone PCu(A)C [Candidatus Saccharibacteria bacterium]
MLRAVLAAALAWPLAFAAPASAAGPLTVEDARARILLPSRPGAAWLTIRNAGGEDRLVGAESPAAERVELHTHIHEGGVTMMRKVEAIDLPAGGETVLESGGDHLMLFGLKGGLKAGDRFPLTLLFEKAGALTVEVRVAPLAETMPKK